MLTTLIRICFHDRRLQYMERDLINQWLQQRPLERILEIDIPLSYGITDVHCDDKMINGCEFSWDPTKETGVFIKVKRCNPELTFIIRFFQINCISTEFTPKKHGGEKGVPFRIVIETYCKNELDPCQCLHAASCQVKVFKPKGADRKHKTDKEKMMKKPLTEQAKFQSSLDCTVFKDCSVDTFALYSFTANNHQTSALCEINQESDKLDDSPMKPQKSAPKVKSTPSSPVVQAKVAPHKSSSSSSSINSISNVHYNQSNSLSDINDNSFELSFSNFSMGCSKNPVLSASASADETRQWLKENRFDAYIDSLNNFCGTDLLLLSKEDMMRICGLTDGIRLYNALFSKTIRARLSLFICMPGEDVFNAIYLNTLTVVELLSKLSSTLLKNNKFSYLKRIYLCGPSSVKVLMTDEVIRNMPDESLFIIDFVKGIQISETQSILFLFNFVCLQTTMMNMMWF